MKVEAFDDLIRDSLSISFPALLCVCSHTFCMPARLQYGTRLPKSSLRITILFILVIFFMVCSSVASVSSTAQRPYDVLYEATFLPIKVEDQFRIHDLMKQIGGSPVGLTWLNVFVMTKGAIIKVVSLLLSIFIFLVQFQQLNEGRGCIAPEDREARAEFISD